MARDFSKNTSNYLSLGQNTVGPLLHGASAISVHSFVTADTFGTSAFNNRIFNVYINATGVGVILSVHDGTSAVLRAGGRSQGDDSLQFRDGTTVLSTGTEYSVGMVVNIGGATITPYLNGTAEGAGGVTFGASTYTDGAPDSGRTDMIGGDGEGVITTDSQFDGRIRDVAIWTADIGAANFSALSKGASPLLIRPDALVFYMPLWGNNSPEPDLISGLTGTITGSVPKADHGRIILPSRVVVGRGTGGGGTTATPDTASLTLTTFAPTVSTPQTVTPGAASLTLTTFAPTVSTPVVATPGVASLTTTGFAPTVTTPQTVTPTTAALTLTTFAPTVTVSGNQVVTPGVATLALTTYAPEIGGSQTATPDTLALAITTYAPTVTTPVVAIPTTATLSLTTFAPTILTPVVCTPGALALVLTRYAPSVSNGELEATIVGTWSNVIKVSGGMERVSVFGGGERIDIHNL